MSAWFYFFAYALALLVGARLFLIWRSLQSAMAPESSVLIPSEMDDWDAEFKERTGILPEFSRLNIPTVRIGQWSVTVPSCSSPVLTRVPGDVLHSHSQPAFGFTVKAEHMKFVDCRIEQ